MARSAGLLLLLLLVVVLVVGAAPAVAEGRAEALVRRLGLAGEEPLALYLRRSTALAASDAKPLSAVRYGEAPATYARAFERLTRALCSRTRVRAPQ